MGPGKQGPLQDESGVWNRVVVGAEGRRISLKGIWTYIRQADEARASGEEGQELRERLGKRLWAACGVRASPRAVARRHGLSAWNNWKRGGTLVVAHLPHRVVQFGNESRAAELVEMEEEIEAEEIEMGRSAATSFDEGLRVDDQARLRWGDGGLVTGEGGLGVLGQLFWNAREAMEGFPVVDGTSMGEEERKGWKGKTFVCPRATGDLWERLRPLVKRWRVQAVWAIDGSYKVSDDPLATTMGRGAARHDGHTMSMALAPGGDDSAFLAEFVAQLDVLPCQVRLVTLRATLDWPPRRPLEALGTSNYEKNYPIMV